ncbi:hypothetical protein [Plectonema radiosum]|nr:hypothetical protein [Plectonema radiosum]
MMSCQNADMIVVLEQGRIIATGTHSELIAISGRYAYLHSMQFPQ